MTIVAENKKVQKTYRDNLWTLIKGYKENNYFILNFNYTVLSSRLSKSRSINDANFSFARNKTDYNISEVNVHGNYEKIAIFGIDQTSINAPDAHYIFSKTFRKISEYESLENIALPKKNKGLDEIIFYGHSLAAADYSYFQSIFYYYDIYHEKIQLTFIFSVYGSENQHSLIRRKMFREITQLIDFYGDSMNNKNHGKI